MTVILGRYRQEDQQFKAGCGYKRPQFQKRKRKGKNIVSSSLASSLQNSLPSGLGSYKSTFNVLTSEPLSSF